MIGDGKISVHSLRNFVFLDPQAGNQAQLQLILFGIPINIAPDCSLGVDGVLAGRGDPVGGGAPSAVWVLSLGQGRLVFPPR